MHVHKATDVVREGFGLVVARLFLQPHFERLGVQLLRIRQLGQVSDNVADRAQIALGDFLRLCAGVTNVQP